jgi:PAS domain-containing protein
MALAASFRPDTPTPVGTNAEAKLGLMEFLLGSVDLDASARQGLDWLARHAGVRQAVCAIVDNTGSYLLAIAERGLSDSAWAFSLSLYDGDHPLVAVLHSVEPVYLDRTSAANWTPLDGTSGLAVPLRVGRADASDPADGVLLIDAATPAVSPDLRWFTEVFGQQVSRLRSRHALEDFRVGRERMLLYSIINAVTDPILLTDTEGKLIIANSRAEKLFTSPDDASEGWRQAVAVNNMLFSAALSSSAMETEGPVRREVPLVDSIEGSDLLFELLSTAVKDPREGTFVVSVLRNVTDLGLAKAEIEESQRKLRAAQAEVREERHRLELIIDSVADPILVTDPAGDIVLMNTPAERLFTDVHFTDERAQRHVQSNGAHFSSFVSNLLFSGEDTRWRGDISLS